MNSLAPRRWLVRPMLRSYSISMPGLNAPPRVVSEASCQLSRAEPIVVLSWMSTGRRTGPGGAGTCEHAASALAAIRTAAARTTGEIGVSGVEGLGIIALPKKTRSEDLLRLAPCETRPRQLRGTGHFVQPAR